ncbi:NADH dehydrogenase [Platysternon megacephalum]|uniref:NADH dehydrogenase n=1 Tax=Platysternon megacephalum TaxID=55544 RepID=A0A4D9DZN2_9SAUR|nr:NADH dehydrogenase [Platysternon megacephalum]
MVWARCGQGCSGWLTSGLGTLGHGVLVEAKRNFPKEGAPEPAQPPTGLSGPGAAEGKRPQLRPRPAQGLLCSPRPRLPPKRNIVGTWGFHTEEQGRGTAGGGRGPGGAAHGDTWQRDRHTDVCM